MTWNYRIIQTNYKPDGFDDEYTAYAIHEVYYNEDGEPDSWTLRSMSLDNYESVEELEESMKLMMNAFKKPVLIEIVDSDGKEKLIELSTH